MNVSYTEKPKSTERSLGNDPNGWPSESDTIWRVVSSEHDKFLVGDLLLSLVTRYTGYAILNLRSKELHTNKIENGYKVKIVQDFTVNTVTLYVDNSARP